MWRWLGDYGVMIAFPLAVIAVALDSVTVAALAGVAIGFTGGWVERGKQSEDD